VVDAAVGYWALAVGVDGLDAVAVRIEQEGAVVVGAVGCARPGCAVARVTAVDPGLPEAVDGRAVGRAEADVQPAGQRVPVVDRTNVPVLPLDQLCVGVARLDAELGEDGAIEPLGGREIGHGDSHVVEHRPEASTGTRHRSSTARSHNRITARQRGGRRIQLSTTGRD